MLYIRTLLNRFPKAPFLLYSVIFLLLAGCLKSGEDTAKKPATPPAMPVTILTAEPTQVPIILEVMAQTEGAKETEVRAQVGGILKKQLYKEGAPVKAGQALFEIDPEPYEIARADARANLAEAKTQVDQTAREELRLRGLLDKNYISRKSYDDAVSDHARARAAQQSAEANVRKAELNLSYTTVTAPVAGISGRAVKSEGSLISTGDESLLTVIRQSNPIWVGFSLSESELAKIRERGGRVTEQTVTGIELKLPDGSTYPSKGRLNFLASSVDTTLGTRRFRAEFDNPDGVLLPGEFVRIRIFAGERDGVFLIPQAAVLQTEQTYLVFVADAENKAAPRPVQVGAWQGKDWIILGGLQAGDRVITDNLIKLRPGAPVVPRSAQDAQPGQPPAASDKTAPAERKG